MPAFARTLPALLLVLPLSARADQFLYAGVDPDPAHSYNFTYISDHRILNDETVTPLTCSVDGQTCTSVNFRPTIQQGDDVEGGVDVVGVGVGEGMNEIDPRFFTAPEQSYYSAYGASVSFFDLPDSVRFFYELSDYYDGKGFELFSPEFITSRTTLSSLVCTAGFGLCTDGGTVTIDPVRGEIIGTGGSTSVDGLHLTGLPASFFQPGDNELYTGEYDPYATRLLVAGRGGAETVTPEPSSLLLLGTGVSAAAALLRRRLAI